MRTCGMMGEVVGKAASICIKENCSPRDVYQYHLPELVELMQLPGRARRATPNDKIDPNAPLPEPSQHPAPPRQGRGASAKNATEGGGPGLDPKKLTGIVVDDAQAKLTGNWTPGTGLKGYVGAHYLYTGEGDASARFEFKVPAAGQYEVRLAYAAHENRAASVPVSVISADGEKLTKVNEKEPGKAENAFYSLGTFRFDPATPGAVVVTNKGAKGHVSVDAVQVVPAK
jgi:hypothetical protein